MNRLHFSIFIALMCLCYGSVWAQCPPGNIALASQQDINDFVAQYPDCTEIAADVGISTPAVTDLSPLTQITSIGGKLLIEKTNLVDLTGLNNLTSVGSLFMGGNYALINLNGLESLNTVDYIYIGNYSAFEYLGNFVDL